jgi:hypothetical protein
MIYLIGGFIALPFLLWFFFAWIINATRTVSKGKKTILSFTFEHNDDITPIFAKLDKDSDENFIKMEGGRYFTGNLNYKTTYPIINKTTPKLVGVLNPKRLDLPVNFYIRGFSNPLVVKDGQFQFDYKVDNEDKLVQNYPTFSSEQITYHGNSKKERNWTPIIVGLLAVCTLLILINGAGYYQKYENSNKALSEIHSIYNTWTVAHPAAAGVK